MDKHYRIRELANYREAEPDKKEAYRRKSGHEHSKREKPKPSRNLDQHKNIIDNLKHINGDQMYNIALKNLRLLYRNDDLSQSSFEYYKKYAERRKNLAKKKLDKKENSVSNNKHTREVDFDDASYENSKERKLERKGEKDDNDDEHKKKRKETRVNRLRSFLSFLKSPHSRVFLFVILGIFLLLYTTRGGVGHSLNSSMVLILVILFMVLILGNGGNTKTYDKSDWYG